MPPWNKHNKSSTGILLSILCLYLAPAPAQAAGFYLQEQSVSALGAANAGGAAQPRDASIVYYNPAAMTGLDRGQAQIGAHYLYPRADMNNAGSSLLAGPALGNNDSDNPVGAAIIPALDVVYPVVPGSLWLGIGLHAPFGLGADYAGDWYGRYDSVESELAVYDIQPSAAFRINDWLSIGGGVDIQYAEALLTSAATNGVTEGLSSLEGDGVAIGWNAGVYFMPRKDTRVGIHFRAPVSNELEGKIVVTGLAGLNENAPGKAMLDLPDITTLSLAHDMNDRWTVLGGAVYYGWDNFERVKAVRDNGTIAKDTTMDCRDTLNLAAGAEYKWSNTLTLRGGYQYDPTPTQDDFRDTRIADGNRHWLTTGATYDIDDRFSIDVAGAYVAIQDASINVQRNGTAPPLATVRVRRDDSWTGVLSAAVNYRF